MNGILTGLAVSLALWALIVAVLIGISRLTGGL